MVSMKRATAVISVTTSRRVVKMLRVGKNGIGNSVRSRSSYIGGGYVTGCNEPLISGVMVSTSPFIE